MTGDLTEFLLEFTTAQCIHMIQGIIFYI